MSSGGDLVGKRVDKTYEILAKLGEGGMGAVYEAQHAKTGRKVAIKVILSEFADETLVARFQREARAAGSIDSRHIAQVLDAGTDSDTGAPYLVMELLKGRDVDALMKAMGAVRPTLALRIVAQALAGLDRAHSAKVIHRDIKPANLFLAEGEGGERIVKLVDFGVAKVKDDLTGSREYSLTQTASLLGSPLYMSPEQARTSKTVDGRADIWSIGTVLYQLLTGEAPHHLAASLTELLLAICTEPATPVQKRAPWVPPDIANIVAKSLEINADQRYPSAAAMLADIEAIVPDWQRFDESMITPLTDEERSFVAKMVDPPPALHVSTGPSSAKTISDSRIVALGAAPIGITTNKTAYDASVSQSEKKEPEAAAAPKRSPILPIAIGVGALAIFGGVFVATRHHDPTPAPLVPATVTVTVSVPVGVPVPAAPASSNPEPAASLTPMPSSAPSAKPVAAPPKPPAAPKPAPSPAPPPPPKPSSISRDFN